MVRHAGLTKQVTIYQSNGDKSSGKIWRLLQDSNIELHLGDNMHSDVNVATDYGINAQYYSGTGFSSIENYLAQNNLPHLALLAREVRLRNKDASSSEFFTTAVSFNLPWLFVVAEMIHRKYKDKHIVFLGRDCQLLQQLYSCYYDDVSTYLPFSRKIAYNKPEISVEYITAHTPPDCVLFDIISTGGTWEHMNKYGVLNVCVALYSNLEHYTKSKPILPPTFDYLIKNSDVGHAGFLLEVHNCADHGHLSDISKLAEGTFVCTFDSTELTSDIINDIHLPISRANDLKKNYQSVIREELKHYTDDSLKELFKLLVQTICSQTGLNQHLNDFYAKENSYLNSVKEVSLTELANKYNSDKGTTYKCGHGYTEYYQQIFKSYLNATVEFKLLEIGLNRDNQESIPSLSIYREFFGNKVTLYGFDIHPNFRKFDDSANKLNIIIGDQSNSKDLTKCNDMYDIIIDDGYHASKHQQVTFSTLWKQLKSGGVYIIEDLHYQPEHEEGEILTKELIRQWRSGIPATSSYINSKQISQILSEIKTIQMFDSKSKEWDRTKIIDAFAVFYKK